MLEEIAKKVLTIVTERAEELRQRSYSLNARAAIFAATVGMPASFLFNPAVPVREPDMPPGIFALHRFTKRGHRLYRVYLREDEIPQYIHACRQASSQRVVEYYINKIYKLPKIKITWKDVQAARLLVWGYPQLIYAYDLGRLVKIAEAIGN